MARTVTEALMFFLKVDAHGRLIVHDDPIPSDRRLSEGFIMAQSQPLPTKSQKIEDARDLQSKLYREIGISAVAAALRFSSLPDIIPVPQQIHPLPGVLRGDGLAA